MLLHDVQARVRIALTTTLTNEWGLFTPTTGTSHPSARSIAFHVGWHLRDMFDESWDIDCDYARSFASQEPSLAFGEGVQRAPDLIVHRRGRVGPEDNLLLVSLTADFASHQHDTPDFETVRSVQLRYGYRYAAWVDLQLRENGPEVESAPAGSGEPSRREPPARGRRPCTPPRSSAPSPTRSSPSTWLSALAGSCGPGSCGPAQDPAAVSGR